MEFNEEISFKTQELGHLGIVASSIHQLKLIDKINARLPVSNSKGAIDDLNFGFKKGIK